MRLKHVVLTASLMGFAGWANVHSEAGEWLGWFRKPAAEDCCYEESKPFRVSNLWSYQHWHDKTMFKRKARLDAIHQWQRWFLNPVVTPDNTCNYGYFETQWRKAPDCETFPACPPTHMIEEIEPLPIEVSPPVPEDLESNLPHDKLDQITELPIPLFAPAEEIQTSGEEQFPPVETSLNSTPQRTPVQPPNDQPVELLSHSASDHSDLRANGPCLIDLAEESDTAPAQISNAGWATTGHGQDVELLAATMESEHLIPAVGFVRLIDQVPTIVVPEQHGQGDLAHDDLGISRVESTVRYRPARLSSRDNLAPTFPIRMSLSRLGPNLD